MGRLNNVGADGATARLIAASSATLMTEALPKESAKTLVALAKGGRLYLEARQSALARSCFDGIDKLLATCDDTTLVEAYTSMLAEVRRYMAWEERTG